MPKSKAAHLNQAVRDAGKAVKTARLALGKTLSVVGQECGVSTSMIYLIESGKTKVPSHLIHTLCQAVGRRELADDILKANHPDLWKAIHAARLHDPKSWVPMNTAPGEV